MDNLKFRTWLTEEKKFAYWGFLIEDDFCYFVAPPYWDKDRALEFAEILEHSQQYIGLEDRSSKEIYDGDITQFGEVVWVCDEELSEFIGWHIKDYWRPEPSYNSIFDYSVLPEIRGNKWENPELLEKVEK